MGLWLCRKAEKKKRCSENNLKVCNVTLCCGRLLVLHKAKGGYPDSDKLNVTHNSLEMAVVFNT